MTKSFITQLLKETSRAIENKNVFVQDKQFGTESIFRLLTASLLTYLLQSDSITCFWCIPSYLIEVSFKGSALVIFPHLGTSSFRLQRVKWVHVSNYEVNFSHIFSLHAVICIIRCELHAFIMNELWFYNLDLHKLYHFTTGSSFSSRSDISS